MHKGLVVDVALHRQKPYVTKYDKPPPSYYNSTSSLDTPVNIHQSQDSLGTMSSTSPLSPTFYGHIGSTQDALLLFETCLRSIFNHLDRRPHNRERASLIKSGNVFVYEEDSSGIKRWTDGVPWSPSCILGDFLVYRELERPFPLGEKRKAMKRSKRSPGTSKAPEIYGGSNNGMSNGYNVASAAASIFDFANSNSETDRSLIGSLGDSYGFKEDGLVKKAISVTVGGASYHLVAYYTVADVKNNKFYTPTEDSRFQAVTPRSELVSKQNLRTLIDEVDNLDQSDDRSVYNTYPYARSGHEIINQTISHHPMSLPALQFAYPRSSNIFNNYSSAPDLVYSDGTNSTYGSQFPRTYDKDLRFQCIIPRRDLVTEQDFWNP